MSTRDQHSHGPNPRLCHSVEPCEGTEELEEEEEEEKEEEEEEGFRRLATGSVGTQSALLTSCTPDVQNFVVKDIPGECVYI